MKVTRREFLGRAVGATTLALPLGGWCAAAARCAAPHGPTWVLLDLPARTRLEEAASGYVLALAGQGEGGRLVRAEPRSVPRCAALIVPAALELSPAAYRTIVACLDGGASVILESGAGFAAEPGFRAQRARLRDVLHVHLEVPVDLWDETMRGARRARSRGLPYVCYSWPSAAKVRDFSRVVPLGPQAGEIIGTVDGLPVALRRRWGPGSLIVLGSPLGPALWAGDAEARRWLLDVLALTGVPG